MPPEKEYELRQLTLRGIPADSLAKLEAEAAKSGNSIQSIIRICIAEHLSRSET